MGSETKIQWTHHTFNPWWGCVRVAQGCKNCYAESTANRWGMKIWGPKSDRRFFADKHWNEPRKWNVLAAQSESRAKVFCGSMCDVCEDRPDLVEPRKRLRDLIESTPWLDWQLLTKRPENFDLFGWGNAWPANVWAGTSAAIQSELDTNVTQLQTHAARIHFLSLEPLVGPIEMTGRALDVDWVIVGGESGPGARPCNIDWIRSIVSQCKAASVPVFVKQLGKVVHCRNDRVSAWLDEVGMGLDYIDTSEARMQGDPVRVMLNDAKGGNPSEWPEDLRVRAFPTPTSNEGS